MSFLNKFKYHYHSKHLETLSKGKIIWNYFLLEKLSSDRKTFHDLSLKYINNVIANLNEDISKEDCMD